MFLNALWRKLLKQFDSACSFSALFLVFFYKAFLSRGLACGGMCRFQPSCSDYAVLVYKKYSFLRASRLVLKRLLDCRPFGPKFRPEPELSE